MMKDISWKKLFFIATVIMASAVIFSAMSPAISQSRGGSFMLAGDSGQFIWRVNVATGQVSYCVRRDNSVDETFIARRPPYCSAQSAPVQ
jgi:hypothetical protein